MRKFYSIGLFLILVLTSQTKAQNSFSFSCAKDTTINGCALSCITLISRIPDIRSSTSDYVINPISGAGGCFAPYVDANTPGNPTSLVIDDRYSTPLLCHLHFLSMMMQLRLIHHCLRVPMDSFLLMYRKQHSSVTGV
jgi:hypothetical protein